MKIAALLFLITNIASAATGEPLSNPHRATLDTLVKKWPVELMVFDTRKPDAVQIVAYETPGLKNAVGLGQLMKIKAPLARVKAVVEDFAAYKDLFFTFKDIRVLENKQGKALLEWEQSVPLPFVPNTIYQTFIEASKKGKTWVYRYTLKSSNTLRYVDTLIFLDALDDNTTLYSEWDFFDAEWGVAATFAPERIWTDSIRDIYYSDVAIKLKAENPDWDYSKIRSTAKESFKTHGDVSVKEHKKKFLLLK